MNRNSNSNYEEFVAGMAGTLGSAILLLTAARSAGLITYEKERDTWLSLVSTPLTGSEIIHGKLLGNLFCVRWPLLVLAVVVFLGIVFEPTFILPAGVLLATMVLLACYATCLGLTYSLRSTTTLRAMGLTLATIVVCGGGYLFCCCAVMMGSSGSGDEIMLAAAIPFLIVFPVIAFSESGGIGPSGEGLWVAYLFGLLAYAVATLLLYASLKLKFDEAAGRTHGVPDRHGALRQTLRPAETPVE
jgi:hypothetical protein